MTKNTLTRKPKVFTGKPKSVTLKTISTPRKTKRFTRKTRRFTLKIQPPVMDTQSPVIDAETPVMETQPPVVDAETQEFQEKVRTFRNKTAKKTIRKFFTKIPEEKRKSYFLKSVCSDSGMCIAVGKEIKNINKFFNHFTDFVYAVDPIKSIGVPSANGFIKEITYTRDGYNSYAILKSSVGPKDGLSLPPDNLMYEYEVGRYINKQNSIFSCFLETYGLFLYKNDNAWRFFRMHPNIDRNSLSQLWKISSTDYNMGCKDYKHLAILIQHINKAKTLFEFIQYAVSKEPNADKKIYELNIDTICILYQIYFTLDILKTEFTHYDLHADNVLLYEPVKNGYIAYHYHLNSGKTVTFHSKYIAKIIDYGRCYYRENDRNNSKEIYKKVCLGSYCSPEPTCGRNAGFMYLAKEPSPGKRFHISSQMHNMSHDLRLANIIKGYYLSASLALPIYPLIRNGFQKIVYKNAYGTPERTDNGYPDAIHNVNDMRKTLEDIIETPGFVDHNVRYNSTAGFTKIGDIHIYEDRRPMEYVKLARP